MFDRTEFDIALLRKRMNMSDLAHAIGIHPSTMYRKVEASGAFTREEIGKIVACLDIEDPTKIFFAEKLK